MLHYDHKSGEMVFKFEYKNNKMMGFPLHLDLSEYFDDLRKYSYVFVNSSKCKDIGDVEKHIKIVFGLEDNICLVHKKFLIPRNESIQLLQQFDVFKVQKCNFYDVQIHKTKKGNCNSVCDQKALNLTQSEKSIDLSCRPKQRLKGNICQSPGSSVNLTFHIDHKKRTDTQNVSSVCPVLQNTNNTAREKQKHKKRKHLHNDESNDDGTDSNILDMSVKNSKRKKHSNCFSTDEGSLFSEGVNDSNCLEGAKEYHKKSKKRRNQLEGFVNDPVDLGTTCWKSLVCNESDVKEQSIKKRSKKIKDDCINGDLDTVANHSTLRDEPDNQVDSYGVTEDEYSMRKKHKHSKKCIEPKDDAKGSQYYSSSPLIPLKSDGLKKCGLKKGENQNESSNSTKCLEEQKNVIKVQIDQMISEIQESNSNSQTEDYEDSVASIKDLGHDHSELADEGVSNFVKHIKSEPCPEFTSTNPRGKRKRKHKKKKKEKLLHMLAVGPALDHLAAKPENYGLATSKSSTPSEIAKHVFFTEDDFAEEMNIPPTPQAKCQTAQDSTQPCSNQVDDTSSQDLSSSKPDTWQDQLLRLAKTNSKPVIFHRSTSFGSTNKQVSTQGARENSTPPLNLNQGCDSNISGNGEVKFSNPGPSCRDTSISEDYQRCNGEVEVKTENNNDGKGICSERADGCSQRKPLPDICKPVPIPNDFQNINLTDYPIIDKVVAEDLILFKVLKLNENNEPGCSKPILARVNETSNFPEKISLQILEGCEECRHCLEPGETGEVFTVELRWNDMIEPRLFYP